MIVPEKHCGLSSNLPGVYVVKTHYPVAVVVWNAPRSDRRPLGKKTGCYGSLYFVCESVIFDIDGLESMIVHGSMFQPWHFSDFPELHSAGHLPSGNLT